jgi:hypothetical protein
MPENYLGLDSSPCVWQISKLTWGFTSWKVSGKGCVLGGSGACREKLLMHV